MLKVSPTTSFLSGRTLAEHLIAVNTDSLVNDPAVVFAVVQDADQSAPVSSAFVSAGASYVRSEGPYKRNELWSMSSNASPQASAFSRIPDISLHRTADHLEAIKYLAEPVWEIGTSGLPQDEVFIGLKKLADTNTVALAALYLMFKKNGVLTAKYALHSVRPELNAVLGQHRIMLAGSNYGDGVLKLLKEVAATGNMYILGLIKEMYSLDPVQVILLLDSLSQISVTIDGAVGRRARQMLELNAGLDPKMLFPHLEAEQFVREHPNHFEGISGVDPKFLERMRSSAPFRALSIFLGRTSVEKYIRSIFEWIYCNPAVAHRFFNEILYYEERGQEAAMKKFVTHAYRNEPELIYAIYAHVQRSVENGGTRLVLEEKMADIVSRMGHPDFIAISGLWRHHTPIVKARAYAVMLSCRRNSLPWGISVGTEAVKNLFWLISNAENEDDRRLAKDALNKVNKEERKRASAS